jgi:hypothetical protein
VNISIKMANVDVTVNMPIILPPFIPMFVRAFIAPHLWFVDLGQFMNHKADNRLKGGHKLILLIVSIGWHKRKARFYCKGQKG